MSSRRSAFAAALIVFGIALWRTPDARADGSKEAEKLFDQGTALLKDGRFPEACAKLEASNRIEPGVGVQLWLANCYERAGKTASAFKQYVAAAQLAAATKDGRDKVAHKHAADLEPQLSKLVIAVPSSRRVPGIEVKRDGEPVKNFGEAVIVDPGTYAVTATAPGYLPWEMKVDVGSNGAVSNMTVGPLETDVAGVPVAASSVGRGVPFWTPMRVAGAFTGGVGLVGIGVGTGFGLIAQSSLDDSNGNNHCDSRNTCDAMGLQLRSDAQSAALFSTVAFVAGGALVAGGAAMFFLSPRTKSDSAAYVLPAVGPGFSGLSAVGRF